MTDVVGLRSFPGPSPVPWTCSGGLLFHLSSLHCQIDQTHLRLPLDPCQLSAPREDQPVLACSSRPTRSCLSLFNSFSFPSTHHICITSVDHALLPTDSIRALLHTLSIRCNRLHSNPASQGITFRRWRSQPSTRPHLRWQTQMHPWTQTPRWTAV